MNLLEIRTKFVQLSGRYDLVVNTTTYADNGADWFINMGQRYLDRLIQTPKSTARVFATLKSGKNHCIFANARAIQEVWVANHFTGVVVPTSIPATTLDATNNSVRTKLEKVAIDELRATYNIPLSSITGSRPLYYAPAVLRAEPEVSHNPVGNFDAIIGFADVMLGKHYAYNGVVVYPPADQDYMIEVWGLFYTRQLSADTDENYWTVNNPNVLMMAAMREMEIFYRNTEGARDWENAIRNEFIGQDHDMVEELVIDSTEMNG